MVKLNITGDSQELNLVVDRNADAVLILIVEDNSNGNPINLSGYSFKASIKSSWSSTASIQDFHIDTTQLASGQVTLSLAQSETLGLPDAGVWDFWWIDVTSKRFRKLFGSITLQNGASY